LPLAALLLIPPALGIAYTLAAAMLTKRPDDAPPSLGPHAPSITILKPLHGAEPRLADNLATFMTQDYAGPVQMICGVAHSRDPAIAAAHAAGAELVVDPRRYGSNAKVSNLVNMSAAIRGEIVVLSDSDIAVAPDYLVRVVTALGEPAVGAVTCLYAGRGDAGFWSRLAAAGIGWQFLPSVLVGLATGRARPCMGSTIAMRRDTLDAIGGFARFADRLADDHAIGEAVRALGLAIAVPRMIVTHGCDEASLAALFRHELRWAVTVRGLDPAGHLGSAITHPFPLALIALVCGAPGGWTVTVAAFAARLLLAWRSDAAAARRSAPLALLPLRDLISFSVFLASVVARRVEWRGSRLDVARGDRIAEARP